VSYQVIGAMADECTVTAACRALGVAVSGYYAWRSRAPSARQQGDAALLPHIRRAYEDSRGLYGSPRVHAVLKQQAIVCSRKRVARLMRQTGLRSRRRVRRRIHTTDSQHERPVAPNLLKRDFSADQPNEKWLGDIVGIWTDEGWLYLAALLDAFSRMIVGWAMSELRDEALVQAALSMALARRALNPELIHHTDRGSQYAADGYQATLRPKYVLISMSKKGDCYDNAMMESFFSTLRAELTELEHFHTRAKARTVLFEFIEGFYNRRRLHSALGYCSPVDFEATHPNPECLTLALH
jgi:putative transposase